ncbi:MAG: hypothetical protein K6F92_03725 [Lachnospiraceae bacterium]|nr:hypothetical protein [Lachnospiraceae bacterium]
MKAYRRGMYGNYLIVYVIAGIICVINSIEKFLINYDAAVNLAVGYGEYEFLYEFYGIAREFKPENYDVNIVLDGTLSVFSLFLAVCVVMVFLNMKFFNSCGSNSSYLLLRAPSRGLYIRTVLKRPLICMVIMAVVMALLGALFVGLAHNPVYEDSVYHIEPDHINILSMFF